MTRSVRIKLIAFVVLSAVGVVYASANYLGLIDKVLGRGYTISAQLEGSGGLYEGSQVTYRGVKIGKVSAMDATTEGVLVTLDLEEDARVPVGSAVFVHNGSAVGEQYLDFEPESDEGPYLGEGDVVEGSEDSLPVDEADLLVGLDSFVQSVDEENLTTVVRELGAMFFNTGRPLQDIIDGGNDLIGEAYDNREQTIRLLERGRTVLRTQQANAGNIRDFADGLRGVTEALRAGDGSIRTILNDGPDAITQVQALLKDLQPILPVLIRNLVTLTDLTVPRLASVEQLLVTYPGIIAGGFTGTTEDGYGHVHLEYTQDPPPCTEGYLRPSQWRPGDDLTDGTPYLQAHCASGLPYAARGSKYAPRVGEASRVAPGDRPTGNVDRGHGAGHKGREALQVVVTDTGADVYGKDAWKWMLIGPTMTR